MPPTPLILVLGSPRSGTSALTRLLSLCGCRLPPSVFAPNEQNPKGFWEPVEAARLNVQFLSRHHSMFEDPSLRLFEERISKEERDAFVSEIQHFLSTLPKDTPVVVKELRITLLMEYWLEAALRSGFAIRTVITVRHPTEVASSWREAIVYARNKYPMLSEAQVPSLEVLTTAWLKANLLAEQHTRTVPRVFIAYTNLLTNWRDQISRIASCLELSLNPAENAISEFLETGLRHHQAADSAPEPFAYSWISTVHAQLAAACSDVALNVGVMDDIYNAYRTNERAFRSAWEYFCHLLKVIESAPITSTASDPVWNNGVDY